MVKRIAQYAAAPFIRERRDFDTYGNLSARNVEPSLTGWWGGMLTQREREALRTASASYVVFSYGTPIAWWSEWSGWTIISRRFSASTDKAQSRVAAALSTYAYGWHTSSEPIDHVDISPRLSLSDAQYRLALSILEGNVRDVTGQAHRTLATLLREGITIFDPQRHRFVLTTKGRRGFDLTDEAAA